MSTKITDPIYYILELFIAIVRLVWQDFKHVATPRM